MDGPDYRRLLGKVARLYYEEDLTQGEVAKRVGLSRPKVQRLLREARHCGVVRITIEPLTGMFCDLERGLEQKFGLREAVVVEVSDNRNQATVAREVGGAAAEYLIRVVRPNDRIVVSWGGSVLGMANGLVHNSRKNLHGILVIQGLGGVGDPNQDLHGAELTKRIARSLGAPPALLPAPGIVGHRGTRDSFQRDPAVASVLTLARKANIAFVGIGTLDADNILVRDPAIIDKRRLDELRRKGAVGDTNLRYFDEAGRPVASDLDDRTIGLDLDDLKKIPTVVALAGGAAKLRSIRAAVKAKLINVLVTDHVTAQNLLADDSAAR